MASFRFPFLYKIGTKFLVKCSQDLRFGLIRVRKIRIENFRKLYNLTNVSLPYFSWSFVNTNMNDNMNWENSDNVWRKERMVSYYISLAEKAIKEGDVDKAADLLEKALEISEHIDIVGVTCVYDMLATIAFRKGNVTEAMKLLEEVVEKLSKSNSKQDNNMAVNFSLKLARLYENIKKFDVAERGFRHCVVAQKSKYLAGINDEETTMILINSLFWYGKFLSERKRYLEAKQCFESVYLLMPHVKSMGSEQAMVTLYNMGEMSFATGDNEGALKHLLNAVLLGRSLKSPDLPIYYNKIGLLYLYRGIYNEARRWCTQGFEGGKRHPNKSIKKESEDCLKEITKSAQSKNTKT